MKTITCKEVDQLQHLVELHNKIMNLIDEGVIKVVHDEGNQKCSD